MFALLFSWVIIFTVSLIVGDATMQLYASLTKRDEEYSLFQTIVIGLASLSLVLMYWSLFWASNHYFLLLVLSLSFVYLIFARAKAYRLFVEICSVLKEYKIVELILLVSVLLVILATASWVGGTYDANYYHHQNIAWNENYKIVPGLGNLEDRYAFNSNYFLLSAIFSFTALFGEAIYGLQSFLLAALSVWVLSELFRSKFEVKRVFILLGFAVFYLVNIRALQDTSTDIFPNLILFYIVSSLVLYPKELAKNRLFYTLIPAFLLTCKLSVFPIIFLSLYVFYLCGKEKNYKQLGVLFGLSFLMGVGWLTRNIILSGYLVYPFYAIDLFDFDWKIPLGIAVAQTEYIKEIGEHYFNVVVRNPAANTRDPVWISMLNIALLALTIVSSICSLVVLVIKRKILDNSIFILFGSLLSIILLWYLNGADPRFIQGAMVGMLVLALSLTVKSQSRCLAYLSVLVFCLPIFTWSGLYLADRYKLLHNEENPNRGKSFYSMFYTPYSDIDFSCAVHGTDMDNMYEEYKLNDNIVLYIGVLGFAYQQFPATIDMHHDGKLCDYTLLEARGSSMGNGFRLQTKKAEDK